ncbi:MAG: DUF3486 family protein [Sphingomonadales bacterium]|nr:MAG: DUF3486 family protein [Sphingomonadales bacterium]
MADEPRARLARSKIDRLSPEIRNAIAEAVERGLTLDQITAHIRAMGVEVSRSGVYRHIKTYATTVDKLRQTREVAAAFADELGAVADDKSGRLLIDLLQGVVFKTLMAATEGNTEDAFDPKELMMLAAAIKSAQQARTIDIDREQKIRDDEARKAREAAAKDVDTVARQRGLPADIARQLRDAIVGGGA